MFIGKVVGSLWATRKDEKLNGLKLLLIEKQLNEYEVDPALVVAVDRVGAGIGDSVLIATGSAGRLSFDGKSIPADMVIVGIIDTVDYPKE